MPIVPVEVTSVIGALEQRATLEKPMPTGIAVTPNGERTFLSFPRLIDPVAFTVGELLPDGRVQPFPSAETNRIDLRRPSERFFSVESVVATDDTTLWVLDSGRPFFLPAFPGSAKLVEIDIPTRTLRRTYVVPYGIARLGSYLNDVRFTTAGNGLKHALITDSATFTPSAIIVIDLATGRKLRRLEGHPSVQPDRKVVPKIGHRALSWRMGPIHFPFRSGVNGIALSANGRNVYFTPLSGRRLWSVEAALLSDFSVTEAKLAHSILDRGPKCVSDGVEWGVENDLYAGDLEGGRIVRWHEATSTWHTVVRDPRLVWVDSFCVANGYLYFTVNQIQNIWPFNSFRDERRPPYRIFRLRLY